MKKFLASFAALTIIGSSATSVVSCGPITFAKLMGRKVSTEIYRGTYKAPISNWSSGVTMQLDDSIILTNAQDTLLATDQHNNFEGDLADAWISQNNAESWSFHVRDQEQTAGHWTSLDENGQQKDEGMIKPIDFYNTFRYVFNPNNMSQVVGVWQSIIKYGNELNQFIASIRDKENSLYDEKFEWDGSAQGKMTSNRYLDRAIMAFNLFAGESNSTKTARDYALDNTKTDEELINDSFTNGKIINSGNGQTDYNLTFNLAKPAPYFNSMAAFLSFAPMPNIAVDYVGHTSVAGDKYGRAIGKKFGYQTIWYSGAYVVKDYNPTLRIQMDQNKFYFNKQNLKIRELDYAYIGNVDVSRQRFYFETGDISEVNIQPTDLAGWNKYVGSDYSKPRFEGANLTSRPQAGTFAMIYNYHSTRDGNANNANVAIAQRSVRGFLRYIFDRSQVASYYSKAMDKTSTSSMLRNTWTSKNLAVYDQNGANEKDYVDYITDDYFNSPNDDVTTTTGWLKQELTKAGLTAADFESWATKYGDIDVKDDEGTTTETLKALRDGHDAFLRNDLLGALVFVEDQRDQASNEITPKDQDKFDKYVKLIGKYDSISENEKLDLMKKQITEDLSKYSINQATLTWLASGSNATTINNNIKDAIRSFNQRVGSDSPIQIEIVETTDMPDYMVQISSGKFTIISNGWVPDYSDPYTFLDTAMIGGALETYTGFDRLFNKSYDANQKVSLSVKSDIDHPEAYDDLIKRMENFTNEVSRVDRTISEPNERYQEFAKIENYGMAESMIMLPAFYQFLDEPPFMSYVNPFTRSTFSSGQAIYRFVGVEMIERLWNHKKFAEEKAKWEAEKIEGYTSIYPNKNGELIKKFKGSWMKKK